MTSPFVALMMCLHVFSTLWYCITYMFHDLMTSALYQCLQQQPHFAFRRDYPHEVLSQYFVTPQILPPLSVGSRCTITVLLLSSFRCVDGDPPKSGSKGTRKHMTCVSDRYYDYSSSLSKCKERSK